MARPAKFNKKAFVSFSILFMGIIITLTGIVLYFAPPGRVAYWVEWKFLGLTKENWQAVHTIFAFLFAIAVGFHIYYNWVIFWSYIKSKVQRGIKMGRELAWAGGLTILILVLTIAQVPPFSTVMDFGEYLSDSWSNEQTEPPIPHAELLSLKEYCEKTELPLEEVLQRLRNQGVKGVDSLKTIGEIAEINGITPAELGQKISGKSASGSNGAGYGYGRMTIAQICRQLQIPESLAVERLKTAGINFQPEEILRDIAERNEVKPIDLFKIIKGEAKNQENIH